MKVINLLNNKGLEFYLVFAFIPCIPFIPVKLNDLSGVLGGYPFLKLCVFA